MHKFGQSEAGLGAYGSPDRIDMDPFQLGQVDHETALAYGVARDVVAAAANGHQQVAGTCKIDGIDDICN